MGSVASILESGSGRIKEKVFEIDNVVVKMIVVENTEPFGCAIYDATDLNEGMEDVKSRTGIMKPWCAKFQEDSVKEEVIT